MNYLSNRESSERIGTTSSGAARANSWRSLPIVRMVNVNLEPGEGSLEELIADTPKGLLIETNKSWSIDDLRLNFQFGCESATEITKGVLGRRYKNPVYTASHPNFGGTVMGSVERRNGKCGDTFSVEKETRCNRSMLDMV